MNCPGCGAPQLDDVVDFDQWECGSWQDGSESFRSDDCASRQITQLKNIIHSSDIEINNLQDRIQTLEREIQECWDRLQLWRDFVNMEPSALSDRARMKLEQLGELNKNAPANGAWEYLQSQLQECRKRLEAWREGKDYFSWSPFRRIEWQKKLRTLGEID